VDGWSDGLVCTFILDSSPPLYCVPGVLEDVHSVLSVLNTTNFVYLLVWSTAVLFMWAVDVETHLHNL
jgi:hypothetical protein